MPADLTIAIEMHRSKLEQNCIWLSSGDLKLIETRVVQSGISPNASISLARVRGPRGGAASIYFVSRAAVWLSFPVSVAPDGLVVPGDSDNSVGRSS